MMIMTANSARDIGEMAAAAGWGLCSVCGDDFIG
jgi:hypothetical protein